MSDDELNRLIAKATGVGVKSKPVTLDVGDAPAAVMCDTYPDFINDASASCALEDHLSRKGYRIEMVNADMCVRVKVTKFFTEDGAECFEDNTTTETAKARRKALALAAARIFAGEGKVPHGR